MRLFTSLIATTAILFAASSAFASVSFVATATTGDGSPLSAVTPGTTLTIDIEMTTSAPNEMIAIGASVNNWDANLATANAGASVVPASVLNTACFPSFGCVGGITQVETGLRVESGVEGPGEEATFLSILGFAGSGGDGSIDIADSGPQFSIVFDIPVTAPGGASTQFRVGTFIDYADAYNGATDSVVNNDFVNITIVPEPGTALLMGLGLAGLAAAGRRE